jgi:hypothetical protein
VAGASLGDSPAKLALLPPSVERAEVEYNDDGEPKNVEALVKALLKDYPDFVGAQTPRVGGSADGGSRGGAPLTRADIEKMKPAEINARWAEVSAALARGV